LTVVLSESDLRVGVIGTATNRRKAFYVVALRPVVVAKGTSEPSRRKHSEAIRHGGLRDRDTSGKDFEPLSTRQPNAIRALSTTLSEQVERDSQLQRRESRRHELLRHPGRQPDPCGECEVDHEYLAQSDA
jgi:hypothetical protein